MSYESHTNTISNVLVESYIDRNPLIIESVKYIQSVRLAVMFMRTSEPKADILGMAK